MTDKIEVQNKIESPKRLTMLEPDYSYRRNVNMSSPSPKRNIPKEIAGWVITLAVIAFIVVAMSQTDGNSDYISVAEQECYDSGGDWLEADEWHKFTSCVYPNGGPQDEVYP
jgi:hypothetical protein